MKIRVLMIGPGKGVQGGIMSLAGAFVPILEQYVEVLYFPTVIRRPVKKSGKISLLNIALAISQYVRFIYALYRFRPHIIHIHTSQGIAWFKDTFYVVVGKAKGCHVLLHQHGGDFDEIYKKNVPPRSALHSQSFGICRRNNHCFG